jgi:hypothetical protein
VFHVGAGNVEFISREAFCILKNANHFHVLRDSLPEHVGDDWRLKAPQLGKPLRHKGAYTDVLEPYGIDHPAGGLAHARRRVAGLWLDGKTFDDDPTQTVEINQMGKLHPVTESPTSGNDGILKE